MQPRSLLLSALALVACASPPPSSPTADAPREAAPVAPAAEGCSQPELASAAERALASVERPGALVVLDLETGAELASAYTGDTEARAVHPGSTLKPFLALAGLRAGAISVDEPLPCQGSWTRDGQTLTCFHEHGALTLTDALATSCNAYFYELAVRTTPVKLAAELRRVGLTDIADAVQAAEGDMPRYLATAIGHADARVTPRALAQAYATMLTAGDDPQLAAVADGLSAAVARGTAEDAALEGLRVAGKTGTASSGTEGDTDNHAWFVGYAPADDPRVLVLAYVKGDGTGGGLAAPLAARVLEAWSRRCEPA